MTSKTNGGNSLYLEITSVLLYIVIGTSSSSSSSFCHSVFSTTTTLRTSCHNNPNYVLTHENTYACLHRLLSFFYMLFPLEEKEEEEEEKLSLTISFFQIYRVLPQILTFFLLSSSLSLSLSLSFSSTTITSTDDEDISYLEHRHCQSINDDFLLTQEEHFD